MCAGTWDASEGCDCFVRCLCFVRVLSCTLLERVSVVAVCGFGSRGCLWVRWIGLFSAGVFSFRFFGSDVLTSTLVIDFFLFLFSDTLCDSTRSESDRVCSDASWISLFVRNDMCLVGVNWKVDA